MAERTRNRGVWAVTAAMAASLTMLSACGVPDSGVPVVAGSPGPGVVNEQPDTPMPLPRPEDANDSAQAVKLYFHAASSEWTGLHEQVGHFLTPRARSVMPETAPGISVVRVTSWGAPKVSAPDEHLIKVKGEVVGELSEQGVLQPTRRSFSHTFEVRYQQTAEGLVWLVAEPPTGYVIS
ncbi:MAG: hypothetical protein GEU94_15000, partial [Micromonosporaceae bacterium]|nr:hypothetical protein [Micromonosporaceae bacterium]